MADFSQVQSIQTSSSENKGILQIKVAGATEPLTITCASVDDAEDMADLIDGYCRLVHDISSSVWSRKGDLCQIFALHSFKHFTVDFSEMIKNNLSICALLIF